MEWATKIQRSKQLTRDFLEAGLDAGVKLGLIAMETRVKRFGQPIKHSS